MESSTAHPAAPIPDPLPAGSSRRGLLAGAGLAGLAGALVACGGGSGGSGDSGGGDAGGAGSALADTSDIPVGGGKIFKDDKVVVTQPKSGEFHAFSAVCTHRGCTVASVSNGTINCACHGSKYSITDAAVVAGPATEALSQKNVKVEGNKIVLA
ncbi:MAG TPA: Rieske (2Fe-2S) protein [Streptosporangiaceae bacterium]|nr:Rieske (2Fe-2S) protein [Streptosporangiaceae bacterium]